MVTIKSYTDLEQSKKLAEILPLESADKHWIILDGAILRATVYDYFDLQEYNQDKDTFREYVPCWSLAALLEILDYPQLSKDKLGNEKVGWMVSAYPYNCRYDSFWYDNPIDACVAMIEKLHELKML